MHFAFVSKFVIFLENNCPNHFHLKEGHVINSKWSSIRFQTSLKECGKMCRREFKCKAIEWSANRQMCRLLSTTTSDGPKYDDYILCSGNVQYFH